MRTNSYRFAIDAIALAAMAAVYLASPRAHAQAVCVDISVPKASMAAHGGKWTELTHEQWQFLRGIFVLDPQTGNGLPLGDAAALATLSDAHGSLVFWIDGNLACEPMWIPTALVAN